MERPERIVFFDGVCGLCNRFVDRLLTDDARGMLRFAPLQGATAAQRLSPDLVQAMESVVYLRDGAILQRSEAALRILLDLGGWRKLLAPVLVLPAPLRDLLYDWIARNRYAWFGKRTTCRVPSPAERERFLP